MKYHDYGISIQPFRIVTFYYSYNSIVSEISPTPTTPVYINTGEVISLDCSLKVEEEVAKASEIKWYKDGTEVVQAEGVIKVTNHAFDGENKIQKSTYTDATIDKNDGGVYKCEFSFTVGAKISFEITVHAHRKCHAF